MTNELKINDTIPTFVLPLSDDTLLDSKELKKKLYIIYFYPKDNTPGCTNEAKDFSSNIEEFKKNNVEVIGISKDSIKKHLNIIEKQNLKKILNFKGYKVNELYPRRTRRATAVNWLIYWSIESSSSLDDFCKLPELSHPSPNPAKGHYGDPEIK